MIRTFEITMQASVEDVCHLATAADLEAKSWNELVWSFEAIKRWGHELEKRFGELTQIDHHAPPDDPPDIILRFAQRDVPCEHTLLEPYPLRWAQNIRGGHGGFVPPLGRSEWTRKELEDVTSGADPVWEDATKKHQVALSVLIAAVGKKLKCLRSGGILLIDDRVTDYPDEREELVREIHAREKEQLGDRLIIFFQRNNNLQFWSALLSANELTIRVSDL